MLYLARRRENSVPLEELCAVHVLLARVTQLVRTTTGKLARTLVVICVSAESLTFRGRTWCAVQAPAALSAASVRALPLPPAAGAPDATGPPVAIMYSLLSLGSTCHTDCVSS